jgi:hypothetical protein
VSKRIRTAVFAAALVLAGAVPALAQDYADLPELARPALSSNPALTGYSPAVPVSAFARAASWFDPSRLKFSTSMSFGTGYGGQSQTLQTMSFRYHFEAPVTMAVSLGNTWGTGFEGKNNFFLEGLQLTYQPTKNTVFHIDYRDMRSPLQYGYRGHASPYGAFRGY